MNQIEAFEKLWAIRGHAEAIVEVVKLEGVPDRKLLVLNDTIDRMKILIKECIEYRKLQE